MENIIGNIISIIALTVSILALFCSLVDTKLFVEYWFSKEYVLLKLKEDHKPTAKTHVYTSNCKLFGVIDTRWYALEVDDNYDVILDDNFLKDGGFLSRLNLQEDYEIILITHKGRKKSKRKKNNLKNIKIAIKDIIKFSFLFFVNILNLFCIMIIPILSAFIPYLQNANLESKAIEILSIVCMISFVCGVIIFNDKYINE